ncbi:MAG TPA: flagellar protein FliS [Aquifex aeolicus]|uniref:Flagellar protein FliS n=1 Tax=Aquifex aeolicus TaxID=63363 RepID=A0A9D0YNE3_AQUAO|nr:flagellar protein FliS [Aquificales bacterium]HIP86331.1 flagellar protein FliS [Aquifex sp.]HIP98190.1 flagellar protein FliS [Aquifex aeolicus]HIQ26627.1 flagellar protein FliS [Aquifex aeolicus]
MQNPREIYMKKWLETASPIEIVVALYEKMESLLKDIVEMYEKEGKNRDTKKEIELANRVSEILYYLKGTLDMKRGGEMAKNLNQFYGICISQLSKAMAEKNLELYKDLLKAIGEMKDAWWEVRKKTG